MEHSGVEFPLLPPHKKRKTKQNARTHTHTTYGLTQYYIHPLMLDFHRMVKSSMFCKHIEEHSLIFPSSSPVLWCGDHCWEVPILVIILCPLSPLLLLSWLILPDPCSPQVCIDSSSSQHHFHSWQERCILGARFQIFYGSWAMVWFTLFGQIFWHLLLGH